MLGEAIAGDTTLFSREDYVAEAWRIVDPVLAADTPVYEYEPGTGARRKQATDCPDRRLARSGDRWEHK